MKFFLAPSILSADFGKLDQEMASAEKYVDLFHVDVMDGHFVPNITFGPPVVASLKTKLPLDCHLMIEHPERYIEVFAKAVKSHKRNYKKCFIVVHREVFSSLTRLRSVLRSIRNFGMKAGIAINPETPLSAIRGLLTGRGRLPMDMVLIMSVHPGFGGQKFIASVLSKIRSLRKRFPNLDIEIDGGINDVTAQKAIAAGANVIVAGSYIFHAKNRKQAAYTLRPNRP